MHCSDRLNFQTSAGSSRSEAVPRFAELFMLVWGGAALVSLNTMLLGAQLAFLQVNSNTNPTRKKTIHVFLIIIKKNFPRHRVSVFWDTACAASALRSWPASFFRSCPFCRATQWSCSLSVPSYRYSAAVGASPPRREPSPDYTASTRTR